MQIFPLAHLRPVNAGKYGNLNIVEIILMKFLKPKLLELFAVEEQQRYTAVLFTALHVEQRGLGQLIICQDLPTDKIIEI